MKITQTDMPKALLVCIHGLGGDAQSTWGKFPEFLSNSKGFSETYDIDLFSYKTGKFGPVPSLTNVARELSEYLATEYPDRDRIEFLTHSQGGLIARRYICNVLKEGGPLKTTKLITFGTPHLGSILANPVKRLANAQVRDLAVDSDFVMLLGEDWHRANAHERVSVKYITAAQDWVVSRTSSLGADWSDGNITVPNKGHSDIVVPEKPDSAIVEIAYEFLLEPGGISRRFIEPDFRQPNLVIRKIKNAQRNRFFFGAEAVPFFARKTEMDVIAEFLDSATESLSWMLIFGSGGVGKSRLAHEICKLVASEWYAGFLDHRDLNRDWRNWQPLMPTLIVVDYAARTSQSFEDDPLVKMLADLSDRVGGQGLPLARPVRLLLLDRIPDVTWLTSLRLGGYNTNDTQFRPANTEGLHLQTIDDPVEIIEWILESQDTPAPRRETLSETLSRFDEQRRPLFALLLAETIIVEPDNWLTLDKEAAIEGILNREQFRFWRPLGSKPPEERVLALATVVRGLSAEATTSIEEVFLPKWDIDKHPKVFSEMTGHDSDQLVWPLEPDILGEYFVVKQFDGLSDSHKSLFMTYAWHNARYETSDFLLRTFADFDPELLPHSLLAPPIFDEVSFQWCRTLLTIQKYMPNQYATIQAKIRSFIEDSVVRWGFNTTSSYLFGTLRKLEINDEFRVLALDHLKRNCSELISLGAKQCLPGTVGFFLKSVKRDCDISVLESCHASLLASRDDLVEQALSNALDEFGSFQEIVWQQNEHLARTLYSKIDKDDERLAERAFETPLDKLGYFLRIAWRHDQKSLIQKLYSRFDSQVDRLAERALSSSLDAIGSLLEIAWQHDQKELVQKLYSRFDAQIDRLDERALSSSLDATGSLLKIAWQQDQKKMVQKLYSRFDAQIDRLAQRALSSSLDATGSLLKLAWQHDQKGLVENLYDRLEARVDLLMPLVSLDALDSAAVFLKRAEKHGRKGLSKTIYKKLSEDIDRLAECAFISPFDKLSYFVKTLSEAGQAELCTSLLEAMARIAGDHKSKIQQETATGLLTFLYQLPADRLDLGVSILAHQVAADWSPFRRPDDKHWAGAANLAMFYFRLEREDIADEIVEGLLTRQCSEDFGRPAYRLTEFSRLLSMIPQNSPKTPKMHSLFDNLGGTKWIDQCVGSVNNFSLAAALLPLGMSPVKSIVRQVLKGPRLISKTRAEIQSGLETKGNELAIAMRLLGCASLCGIAIPKGFVLSAGIPDVVELPVSIIPHREEGVMVEGWQYSLWLGLRTFVSIRGSPIGLDKSVIEWTLKLWIQNLQETTDSPETPAHCLNQSMVRWLEDCLEQRVSCLLPSRERLGNVAKNI